MIKYNDFIARKTREYGEKFSADDLNPAFINAFNNGDRFRVLVDFGYDAPIWGYVGVTTGWRPCFLLMRRRGQHGSSETINANCKILDGRFIK